MMNLYDELNTFKSHKVEHSVKRNNDYEVKNPNDKLLGNIINPINDRFSVDKKLLSSLLLLGIDAEVASIVDQEETGLVIVSLLQVAGLLDSESKLKTYFIPMVEKSLKSAGIDKIDSTQKFINFFFYLKQQVDKAIELEPNKQKDELINIQKRLITMAYSLQIKYFVMNRTNKDLQISEFVLSINSEVILNDGVMGYSRKSELKIEQEELLKEGITSEQRKVYNSLSDRLYRTIYPAAYYIPGVKKTSYIERLKKLWHNIPRTEYASNDREDAWRLYLGMPQVNNTFRISPFIPSICENKQEYYYSIPAKNLYVAFLYFIYQDGTVEGEQGSVWGQGAPVDRISKNKIMFTHDSVMGKFIISHGIDDNGQHYISYYDEWDLDPDLPIVGSVPFELIAGKPLEIYDRIYFDIDTGDIISPKNLSSNL